MNSHSSACKRKGQQLNAVLELVFAVFSYVQNAVQVLVRFYSAKSKCSKTGNTAELDVFSHLSGETHWKESTAG